jgi:hypothetical protein
MMRSVRAVLLGVLVAAAPAGAAFAQAVWPKPEANLFVGNLDYWWASQIARAANEWNKETDFTFKIKGNDYEACDKYDSGVLLRPDEQQLTNGVEFSDTMCFLQDFPFGVLAVDQEIIGFNGMLQKGLVFNDAITWDVFHGPNHFPTFDFHRVAVHELGHFLGLPHNETDVSIMNPIVSDEIEDIQPADIVSANGLYAAPAPEEPEEPAPDPLVACETSQLGAASRLCKAELQCQAKHAKDPARDAGGSKRDGCVATAASAFAAAWDAAVAAGAAAGGCHAQSPGIDVAPLVGAATAGAIGLIGEGDTSSADDRALRTKLLKRASAMCGSAVGAWKKDAVAPNPTKLANTLARSRAGFASAATKAVANARAKGVSYDGANEQLIADELESLASDLGGMTGPQ